MDGSIWNKQSGSDIKWGVVPCQNIWIIIFQSVQENFRIELNSITFVYLRFFLHLKELGLISQMPNASKEWIDVSSNETSMHGDMDSLTPYEIENCPWWLDMTFPQVLSGEKENFQVCSQNKGQTLVINGKSFSLFMISIKIYWRWIILVSIF